MKGYAMKDHIHMLLMILPKIQCCEYDRFSEREIGYTDIQRLFVGEKEFYRSSFVGAGLLCKCCWIR
jgi:hypothetical protein